MRSFRLFVIIFCVFFSLNHLEALSKCRLRGNDTVVSKEDDRRGLMNYLKGTWQVRGSWSVIEGRGKVKHTAKAMLIGTESFVPILEGHYMQKSLKAKVSYHSRDLDRKESMNFSTLAIMTFNNCNDKFYYWYYDSAGSFFEAEGSFSMIEGRYTFNTEAIDEQGKTVYTMHTLTIVDKNQYKWQVLEKKTMKDDWSLKASGVSKRK